MRKKVIATLLGLACVTLAAFTTALAHHSFSAYDMKTSLKAEGTVKVFRWGAPHSTVVLVTKDKKEMALLSGNPAEFLRKGIQPRDIRPGMNLSVVYHPNGNGKPGGIMASMTLPDGKTWASGEVTSATGKAGEQ